MGGAKISHIKPGKIKQLITKKEDYSPSHKSVITMRQYF